MSLAAAEPATMGATSGRIHARSHTAEDGRVFFLRMCASTGELDECVALQQQTWGYGDLEVVPRTIYVLAQALGGHVLGAWDERGELAGFAMAVAAHEPPGKGQRWMQPVNSFAGDRQKASAPPMPYLHSHMLSVAPSYRDCGLGYALKHAQRAEALTRGIQTIRWTFDPLMAKNAHFNLHRLGATARLYIPDFYGPLSSALGGSLPTDRLLAEWDLSGLQASAAGQQRQASPREVALTIHLPAAVAVWKREGARGALELAQSELRTRFEDAFALGFEVGGFRRDPDGGGQYLLVAARQPRSAPAEH